MARLKKHYKVGVVGLGHQSMEDHLPAILASSDLALTGVADIDEKKLSSFLKDHSGVKVFKSAEEMLESMPFDFIVLATPHYEHFEIVRQAASRKIHVLKEKPFAISLEEAKRMKRIIEESGIQVMVTLQRRFNPIYSTFFQLIDKIGAPFFIEGRYTLFTNSPHDGWRGKKELAGGGCIIDMGYHIIDLLMWYFGLPDRVICDYSHCAKENEEYSAEDTAQILFQYHERNIFGSLFVSRVVSPKQEFLHIYGTRGNIYIERGKIEHYSTDGTLRESLERKNHWPSAARDQLEFFLKVIRGERENIGNPNFHLNHLAFIEAAYRSKESGKYINPKHLI